MTTHCAQSMPPRPSPSFFVAISCYNNNGQWQQGRQAGYNHIINAKGLFATAIVREMGASSSRRLKGLWMVLPTKRGEKNRTPKSVRLPWEPQKLFGCLNWWWLDYKSGQESDTTTTRGDAMVRRLVFSSHVIAT